jgi:hypothetical protein
LLSSSSPCSSHPPMPSKVMVQARLSRLMVATQQVKEKYDMKVNKGG